MRRREEPLLQLIVQLMLQLSSKLRSLRGLGRSAFRLLSCLRDLGIRALRLLSCLGDLRSSPFGGLFRPRQFRRQLRVCVFLFAKSMLKGAEPCDFAASTRKVLLHTLRIGPRF